MLHSVVLHYFQEVARVGSIRKAANTLNVAASAINRQILNLEADLGTPLFDRLPGGVRLTTAGDILLRHVTDTLHDFDGVRATIDGLRAARSGHIRVVAIDSLLVDFLPRVIDRFRIDFPAVTYAVSAVQPPEVPSLVAGGEAEMGFTFVGQLPPSLRYLVEIPAPIGVVMRAGHPLAARLTIELEEAGRYPILTQAGPLPKGADADAAFTAFKSSITPRLQSNSIQMIKNLILLDMGISFFTPLGFLREIESGEVVWRPLASPEINLLKIGLVASATRDLAPPARQFVRQIIDDMHRYLMA